jgi:hypothetical protein
VEVVVDDVEVDDVGSVIELLVEVEELDDVEEDDDDDVELDDEVGDALDDDVEIGRVVVGRGRSSAGLGGIVDGGLTSPHGRTGRPPGAPSSSSCAAGSHSTPSGSIGERSCNQSPSSSRPMATTRSARPSTSATWPSGQSNALARESRTVAGSGSATGSRRPLRSSATPIPKPTTIDAASAPGTAIRPRT